VCALSSRASRAHDRLSSVHQNRCPMNGSSYRLQAHTAATKALSQRMCCWDSIVDIVFKEDYNHASRLVQRLTQSHTSSAITMEKSEKKVTFEIY
jgi:hypothetical protein